MRYYNSSRLDFEAATREHSACGVGAIVKLDGVADHHTLRQGLEALATLAHRTGVASDNKIDEDGTLIATGDGAGIITQIPYAILASSYIRRDRPDVLVDKTNGQTKWPGVGVFFLPRDRERDEEQCKRIVQEILDKNGYKRHKWRETPINAAHLGKFAKESHPRPKQLMILPQDGQDRDAFNRDLYFLHREIENRIWEAGLSGEGRNNFHISSMSAYTMVHKSLSLPHRLEDLYPDLENPKFETAFVGFHGRFSTNTAPAWWRAHFKRMLAHNGEINTLKGNVNAMYKLENIFAEAYGAKKDIILKSLLNTKGSDSDMLDNAFQFLVNAGLSLPLAKTLLVPPAVRSGVEMSTDEKSLYQFTQTLSPGWEGPGMFIMTDGKMVLAGGDLNGMRPTPYEVFGSRENPDKPNILVVGSERGMLHNLMVTGANYSDLKRLSKEPGMKNADEELKAAFETSLRKQENLARDYLHKLSIQRGNLAPGEMIGAVVDPNLRIAGKKIHLGFHDNESIKDIAALDASLRFSFKKRMNDIRTIKRHLPDADDFPYAGVS